MTVVAVVAATVTLPFGESVIGVQLDAIAREFGVQGAALQWVVNAYMLTFATGILAVGVAADRFGRRRFFALGLALAGLSNAAAIFSPSLGVLIGLRALAGLGAGTLLVTGPALLSARFPQAGRARSIAFAAFGSAAGSGIALGPPVGGVIMGWSGWRMVFIVYLPFLLVSAVLLPRLRPSVGNAQLPVDRRGILLFTLLMGLLIWALSGGMGSAAGRLALWVSIGVLAVALALLERRHAFPAIDPAFFGNPVFLVMSLVVVCWQVSIAVSMLYVPAVVVAGMAGSPMLAGASIVPMAIALFLSTPLGPQLVRRRGVEGYIVVCVGFMMAGDALIGLTLSLPSPWAMAGLAGGLVLMGMGGGAANGSMDNLALATISPRRAGAASGVFQTVRIGAAALAAAAAGAVLNVAEQAAGGAANADLLRRYAAMAGVNVLLMGLIAGWCLWWIRRRGTTGGAVERPGTGG